MKSLNEVWEKLAEFHPPTWRFVSEKEELCDTLAVRLRIAVTAMKKIKGFSGGASPWAQSCADTATQALREIGALESNDGRRDEKSD